MTTKTRKTYKPPDYEHNFDHSVFKERLEQLLTQLGITQTTLADSLGVQPLTVTRWKNGSCQNAIAYKHIVNMAKIFGVDEEYLYDKTYCSPHLLQETVDQNIEEGYERFQSFISFMNTIGFTVEPTPMGKCIIFKKSDSVNTYGEITWDEVETLIHKIALFTEMQLL